MSRILVCGVAPLPGENTLRSDAPGVRTWQFAWGLSRGGHEVHLVALKTPGAYLGDRGASREERDGVTVERVEGGRPCIDLLRRRLAVAAPDAVVGAGISGSYALASCRPRVPLWADQHGHLMAEAQARAARDGSNAVLPRYWRLVRPVMAWADKVSVVSARQRYAAIGELGAIGRLSAETCGYEFTAVVPCAVPPVAGVADEGVGTTWREGRVPADAFLVLWSGSYNTWSDAPTLFAGLELAMRRDARIHFVSTGGAVPGQDDRTYPAFRQLVASSDLASRFHLEGWIESRAARALWSEADLGVLTEQPIYEGWLGSRNRVVQWVAAGLPVACTRTGDLGQTLADGDLALSFAPGDPQQLADRLVWAASHRENLRQLAERARAWSARWSVEATTAELTRWAAAPSPSPDAATRGRITSPLGHERAFVAAVHAAADLVPALRRLGWARRRWRRGAAGPDA
jgi:glycosyltransferase involved in cell wall biosynthesis